METSVSLLERLRTRPDDAAWRRFDDLYRPLIRGWLRRDPTLGDEADDLVQEVMTVLVRALPTFERQQTGSFRAWLRTLTANRLKEFWRNRRRRPHPLGDPVASPLAQLADPDSALSRQWDAEHDQHVLRRLQELIEPEFNPQHWRAFRRLACDGATASEVAAETGLTVNAVLLAKSRILKRLREEAKGFLD